VPSADLSPLANASSLSAPGYRDATPLGGSAWDDFVDDQPSLSSAAEPATQPWENLVGTTPFEQGKSILAGIGVLAIMLRLTSVLAGGRD